MNPESEWNVTGGGSVSSEKPAKFLTAQSPSETMMKHHGCEITKALPRKERFLFSFQGKIAMHSSGKIGELKDIDTPNPIVYLDFDKPKGRLKFVGKIARPVNKRLTLLFSDEGNDFKCEDYFHKLIVLPRGCWIGTKEQNPQEHPLELPKELLGVQQESCNFTGGAGTSSKMKPVTRPRSARIAGQRTNYEEQDDEYLDSEKAAESMEVKKATNTAMDSTSNG